MNQDQARLLAEEVELPKPDFYVGLEHAPVFSEKKVREAIAAALVKYTEGQEPVLCVASKDLARLNEADKSIRAWLPPATKAEDVLLYTNPIPSQQEERKPLTDEQRKNITAMWNKENRNYTVADIIDAVEAAHNIKEQS